MRWPSRGSGVDGGKAKSRDSDPRLELKGIGALEAKFAEMPKLDSGRQRRPAWELSIVDCRLSGCMDSGRLARVMMQPREDAAVDH